LGLVFAEKFKNMVIRLLSLLEKSRGTAREVFPTPESPVIKMGFFAYRSIYSMYLYLSVSIVGTIIS